MRGESHKFVGTVWEYSQTACDALLPIFAGVCVFVRVRVCVPAVPLIRMAWLGTTPPTGACNDVYPRAAQSSKQQRQRTVANSNHRAANSNHSRQRTAAAYSNHAPTIRLIGTHGACHLQPHRQLPRPIGTKSWGVFPGCVPDSDPDRANAD